MKKINLTDVMRLYKVLCRDLFPHVNKPMLRICLEENPELFGQYWPDENIIDVFVKTHDDMSEIADTLIHELCHAEQEKRQQPLLHGPRFSRRIRNQKRRLIKMVRG